MEKHIDLIDLRIYCKEWSWGYKEAYDYMLPKEAQQLHEKGEKYTVLIGSMSQPLYVIELRKNEGFFAVDFVDDWGRNYLTHHFQKYPDSERYYLSMAVWREYMSLESHELAEGETYFFNAESDEYYVLKEDFVNKERYEKTEPYSQKDKVILFPEFGKYDEILNPNII